LIFNEKHRFSIWVVAVLFLLGLFGFQFQRGLQIETNILSLLPETEKDPVLEQAITVFSQNVTPKVLFLLETPDEDALKQAAEFTTAQLEESPLFDQIIGRFDDVREKDFYQLYFPYRYQLLSAKFRALLEGEKGGTKLTREAEKALYSPLSSVFSSMLDQDPLLLFSAYLEGLPQPPGALSVKDGWLGAEKDGRHFILITANTKQDAFSPLAQKRVVTFLKDLQAELQTGDTQVKLSVTGMIRYAAAGAEQAQDEVFTIGVGSMLGVLLLFVLVFRSLIPIVTGLLPIVVGLLAACCACFLFFPKVHMITLGFGAGLVGVCIDYTFHYFCEYFSEANRETPWAALRRILPAITLGVITSIMGYAGMFIAPFPGLRQMALFSSTGLIFAWLTTVFAFPYITRHGKKRKLSGLGPAYGMLVGWSRLQRPAVLIPGGLVLVLILGPGLMRLEVNDDIRALQAPPLHLQQEELRIREVAGSLDAGRFLLVEGKTPGEVLQNEERIIPQLAQLRKDGKLGFFQGISMLLPSESLQRENRKLLQDALLDGELSRYLREMEFEEEIEEAAMKALSQPMTALTPQKWLEHPASQTLRHLWIGETARGYASMILLGGFQDASPLEALEARQPQVHYIDKVGDYSALMKRYRNLASLLTGASYLVIFLVLIYRYGFVRGLRVMAPPVISALAALAIFGYMGREINLFNILALLLVLGIGIDYTIFFAESKVPRPATMLAVLLSSCTTILSFGLLALSQTPVLSQFGLTVLVGILAAFLLSPLAMTSKPERHHG